MCPTPDCPVFSALLSQPSLGRGSAQNSCQGRPHLQTFYWQSVPAAGRSPPTAPPQPAWSPRAILLRKEPNMITITRGFSFYGSGSWGVRRTAIESQRWRSRPILQREGGVSVRLGMEATGYSRWFEESCRSSHRPFARKVASCACFASPKPARSAFPSVLTDDFPNCLQKRPPDSTLN